MKVTVVGAGAVGATCADNIARAALCDELVLLDIKEGLAEGKAIDMMQTAALLRFDTRIVGSTNDYVKTKNSDVVLITSGIPRKPGMTREELIGQPHNVLRHPDMPQALFQSLWETMTAGKKWHGYIKNLCKDGSHYWVYATAVPNVR